MAVDIGPLVQYIMATIPGVNFASNERQLVCRCPICMDSSDPSSAHFYIGPLEDSSKPLQYDCKKCGSSGIFNNKIVQLFGVYDIELATLLSEYNNSITGSPIWQMKLSREGMIHHIQNTRITDCNLSVAKIKYINERLGIDLDTKEILDNKIILNLYDILDVNHINRYTRADNIVDELNKYFIGFLSYDNGYLNMRRLCKEGKVYKTIDKRYVNYNIFNTIDNSKRFYLIPVDIDLIDPNPIDVWITEGPFDALSVKYNVRPNKRSIYISAGGKGYIAVIRFILETLGLINLRFHLCPDGDVSDYAMYKIADILEPFGYKIEMHRNISNGQKDFGVPKDMITESIQSLSESNI